MIYNQEPIAPIARKAWKVFKSEFGVSPENMSCGRSEFYGQIWTAETKDKNGRTQIWAWKRNWTSPIMAISGRVNNF